MNKTKHGMFSIWKIIGLVIALASLGYKLVCTAENFDGIADWWGGTIFIFFAFYLINLLAIATTFTRGPLTMALSIGVLSISVVLIGIDGLMFLGFAASSSSSSITEAGLFPFANFLNAVAGLFNFLGFLSIDKREKKKAAMV